MKTIHVVTGSNQSARIRYIQQKGGSHFSFDSTSSHSSVQLLSLSLKDALSKKQEVFIEADRAAGSLVDLLEGLKKNKGAEIFSYYLATPVAEENFLDSERDFAVFLQIPHRTIYFDYFPKI